MPSRPGESRVRNSNYCSSPNAKDRVELAKARSGRGRNNAQRNRRAEKVSVIDGWMWTSFVRVESGTSNPVIDVAVMERDVCDEVQGGIPVTKRWACVGLSRLKFQASERGDVTRAKMKFKQRSATQPTDRLEREERGGSGNSQDGQCQVEKESEGRSGLVWCVAAKQCTVFLLCSSSSSKKSQKC